MIERGHQTVGEVGRFGDTDQLEMVVKIYVQTTVPQPTVSSNRLLLLGKACHSGQ